MEPENAIHRFDLGRFDEAGMRDRDRMHDTFERFLPEFQKTLQFREIWAEVVVLPDAGLQQPGMVRAAGTGCSRWLGRTPLSASENLARSRESPGPCWSK